MSWVEKKNENNMKVTIKSSKYSVFYCTDFRLKSTWKILIYISDYRNKGHHPHNKERIANNLNTTPMEKT